LFIVRPGTVRSTPKKLWLTMLNITRVVYIVISDLGSNSWNQGSELSRKVLIEC